MSTYLGAVKEEFKDWKKALPAIIFTIARLIYGWEWLNGGIEKLAWFTNGKLNSAGLQIRKKQALMIHEQPVIRYSWI